LTISLNTFPRCSKSSNISKLAQAGDNSSGNIQGKTIVTDGTNITWSQAGRTKKRHQIRAKSSNISKLAQAGDNKIAPLSIKVLATLTAASIELTTPKPPTP
jgi:predicted NAD/FAD-dependent oxidoreductase